MKKKWIRAEDFIPQRLRRGMLFMVALAICAIVFAGCKVVSDPEPIAVESVSLSETTLTLAPGTTRKLTATVKPDNADDKSVKWSSSDTSVVMVDNDGTVWAIKVGTTIITAQAGGKTAMCMVTVNEANVKPDSVAVESVTLNAETLTIELGKTRTLTATVTPENADDKTVVWSSSNTAVATVVDGAVTAVAEGTAIITAKAGEKTATCAITVKLSLIAVDGITLNNKTLALLPGETGKLTATVTPDNADDKTVLWSSSDTAVATVSNDGTVTAHKSGTATITAQAGDKTTTCTVTVNSILVESVTLDKTTLTLAPGMTGKLTATVKPDNADDKTVKWSSSNTSVAMVDNNGTIGAINTGKTTVTVQAGGKTAVCEVIVHTDHSYSGGKCTLCGAKPYMENGTIDDNGVLTKYSGNEVNVVIPDGVTGIGDNVFKYSSNLTRVTIPDSVTRIGSGAFWECKSLTDVTIPGNVTSIGLNAFFGCEKLTSVTILKGVTIIGDFAFLKCTSLASVSIPDSVTSIGKYAFNLCNSLTSVTIPGSVMSIGDYAFNNCTKLTNVTILTGVTSIGYGAFNECTSLTGVVIPDSVTNIGDSAFRWCSALESIVIPDGVTSIGDFVFSGCIALTSVLIPGSVTSIGSGSFNECRSLTNITIPSSVTSIGSGALIYCEKLSSVKYDGTMAQWNAISVDKLKVTVHCTDGDITE